MYENDPLGQLTNIILPKLIAKMKEQKERMDKIEEHVAQMQQDLYTVAKATPADGDSVAFLLEQVQGLRNRLDEMDALKEKPKPAVKRRKSKKSSLIKPDDLTCVDVLYANYALAATGGNVTEACAIMPEISLGKMNYIEQMTTEEILELWDDDLMAKETTIDHRYARSDWRNAKKECRQ